MFGNWIDIVLIVFAVIVVLAAGLYFLNRWANKRYTQQNDMVQKSKQSAEIYVIDMKRDKAENVTLPKVVTDNLGRTAKMMKMHFVKAKVGAQVVTLMCDKNIFSSLEAKKKYKVELAGIYIVSVKGAKTKFEIKEIEKAKKAKAKVQERLEKQDKKK